MLRHATTGMICSPVLGVVILGVLAGCARSEHPLSNLEDGFIDPYLLGTWYEVSIGADGIIDTPHNKVYEVTLGDDGYLLITGNRKYGGANIFSGHSTRIGTNKFLNRRDRECRECGDLAAHSARSSECPYNIFQYTTYVPSGLVSTLREGGELPAHELEAWMEDMRGQLVFFRGLLDKPVRNSIAKGDIQGDTVYLDPYETTCIRSKGDALHAFVVRATENSGMSDWGLYSRTSLRGATLDGIAIGTPRRALLDELLDGGCQGPETIINETIDEITTLGYAESEDGFRVKHFKLEDRRLAEIRYGSPDTASIFAHAAQEMTSYTHPARGGRQWRGWVGPVQEESAFEQQQYYLPLLDCIESLEQEKAPPSNTDAATGMLSDCMLEKGWGLLPQWGSGWPVCRGMKP